MQSIAAAAFSGSIPSEAAWYTDGLAPSIERTTTAAVIRSRQSANLPPGPCATTLFEKK
jgi:hypothetical protein